MTGAVANVGVDLSNWLASLVPLGTAIENDASSNTLLTNRIY